MPEPSPRPAASAWSEEKNASVDWSSTEDVLANGFTFLQILAVHPRLAAYMAQHKAERERCKMLFLSPTEMAAQADLLRNWHQNSLLTLRTARWCRHCGRQGHTRHGCPELQPRCASAATPSGPNDDAEEGEVTTGATGGAPQAVGAVVVQASVFAKHVAHQQHLERLKLLSEHPRHGRAATNGGDGRAFSPGGPPRRDRARENKELVLFADERRRGVVSRVDAQYGIGFARVHEFGELKFFLDRTDFGVKEVAVGEPVTLRVDLSRDYPIATDVRPEKTTVTQQDVLAFVARCEAATQPIRILTTLLTHRQEWYAVLHWLCVMRDGADRDSFTRAVHAIVELTTFLDNREPIHLPMLTAFLQLTLTPRPASVSAAMTTTLTARGGATARPAGPNAEVAVTACDEDAFFPTLVHTALERQRVQGAMGAFELEEDGDGDAATPGGRETKLLRVVHRWTEVVNYMVLLRQFANVAAVQEGWGRVQSLLEDFFESRLRQGATEVVARACHAALHRLRCCAVGRAEARLLPTDEELLLPAPHPHSFFTPANLPVVGGYDAVADRGAAAATEGFVKDQCTLLRADTFEVTSRVLCASCFALPEVGAPSQETIADVEHAAVYDRVCFRGRVITRDRDYARPNSFILQLEPKSAKASLRSGLRLGTTVCIATALDKTVVQPQEIFWGVVSSSDVQLLQAHMVVLTPCEEGASFELLQERLERNERLGRSADSLLLETPVFMAGYAAIMSALRAFLGPLAMPLPMAAHFLQNRPPSDATAAPPGTASRLVPLIPPHCERAFREFTDDVRIRFHLDAGQDTVMRRLVTSEVLLVQGPPGTGKSFTGSRIVETHVRYKQLVASGDVLQKLTIEQLPPYAMSRPGQLLPTLGPVVVITYKNHALDEFLVDLLDSGLWDCTRPGPTTALSLAQPTGGTAAPGAAGRGGGAQDGAGSFPAGCRLVRIGGSSRESRLDPYNLSALLRHKLDKTAIGGLKERLFVMQQRLERLTKEIHYLECGRVPRAYFERWLTPEQRSHMSYDDREAWLAGRRYVGVVERSPEPNLYLRLLRTKAAEALSRAAATRAEQTPADTATARASAGTEEDDGVTLSVFQEMRHEDERREYNPVLHTSYLSAEAMRLAARLPECPAAVPADLQSLWSLDPVTRHEYYAYLIQRTIANKARDCLTIMEAICHVRDIRNHAMDEAKLALLRGADVVGLTTTGCAMNQNLLRSLRPSVLVVEEAAEVLESQVLACMTDSLRQIILIGDHYQLQPKVDTFLYEKINHLNVSLFERLARHLEPIRLTEQRRMHPEIARLVRPFYAPQPLIDHASLFTRPFITATGERFVDRVPGLVKRVYFWRHSHPEEEAPGSRSKINTREIRMVQQVVTHLIAQGVRQRSITVITPYLGQSRMLRSVMRLASLAEVRVSTVDLFQGDENDIIILSLVRTGKLTEFIRMRNRLIVSCSRARFAMVIVGNDTLLRQSAHWTQVLDSLAAEDCVGERLPITCRHASGYGTTQAWLQVRGTTSAAALTRDIANELGISANELAAGDGLDGGKSAGSAEDDGAA